MSWSNGARVAAEEIWELMRPLTCESDRQEFALRLIEIFEDADCNNTHECELLTEDSENSHSFCPGCGADRCGCDTPYGSDDIGRDDHAE